MPILDITSRMGMVRNRISKLGIELEGGWEFGLNPPDRLSNDASVFDRGRSGRRQRVLPAGMTMDHIAGEAVSSPLVPAGYPAWIRRCYPRWVDDTCALHVHISFKNLSHYEILSSSVDYNDTLIHHLTQWAVEENRALGCFPEDHCIWPRLRGESRFAMLKYWPHRQIACQKKPLNRDAIRDTDEGHRYTFVNYCLGVHGTLEVRGLPMMPNKDLAIRAVRRVVDVTNACLVVMATKPEAAAETVVLLPENYYEEVDQEII